MNDEGCIGSQADAPPPLTAEQHRIADIQAELRFRMDSPNGGVALKDTEEDDQCISSDCPWCR